MQVAIDARNMQDHPTSGIGRVLRHVVPLLDTELDVTLLYDARRGPAPGEGVVLRSVVPSATAWLQDAAPRWLRGFPGVFHCPFYGLPYWQPVPMVVSIWDLTFEFRPDWLPAHKRIAFRAQARHAARTARRIIVASEVVRDDVCERYRVSPDRVVVAPLAADPRFGPPDAPRTDDGPPYVVAFGGAPRRRLDVAMDAWRRAGGPGLCRLVIVGPQTVAAQEGVVHAGPVDDDALATLLAGAEALLYPTEYEGFGLPALEAQASGVPVVCSRVGALPEVLGGVAAWADGTGPDAFARALKGLLDDDVERSALAEAGLASARARPAWADAAAAFARAYREAAAS